MAVIGELLWAVIQGLMELTVLLAQIASEPVRFVFSSAHRTRFRRGWSQNPVRSGLKFAGGSVVLFLFVGMLTWWVFFFAIGVTSSPDRGHELKRLEQGVVERLKDEYRKKHPRKVQPTPTNAKLSH